MAKKTPETGVPKFPYTTLPHALRLLLTEIPKRPKPPKVTMDTLKAWNVFGPEKLRFGGGPIHHLVRAPSKPVLLGAGEVPFLKGLEILRPRHAPSKSRLTYAVARRTGARTTIPLQTG
jgi:hypothetical protein